MPVNELINETSPYLLQHAHNAVNWHAWGKTAFEKAKSEDKMVIVSVGYSACHWCHVMAHESFEDKEVAELMNGNFISIKVDREERPDIDIIYMAAAQLINGNGGWPLNAIALPDGRPFFAATYFPKDRWIQLLQYFINEYKTNKGELVTQASQLAQGISQVDKIPFKDRNSTFTVKDAEQVFNGIFRNVDNREGGLASNIKFPMPGVWEWLLEYYHFSKDERALKTVKTTLNKMKDGGIYDQIGGGFARYSTDPHWHLPHFEKMVYDNAQLISLYSHAFQITGDEEYRRIAEETIAFLKNELFDGRGFYSSIDADSEKEEGKYYVWKADEIDRLLGVDAEMFKQYFGIVENGNWEDGKNIPDRNRAKQFTPENIKFDLQKINQCRKELLRERKKRISPSLDDKILTGWNAMATSGLLSASNAFGSGDYAELAEKNLIFIEECRWDAQNRVLFRNLDRNKKITYGFLDDYAFFIKALIECYQYNFDIHYLRVALDLTETVMENFDDDQSRMFFYNDRRFEDVVVRPREVGDNVIPSSNSVMAENLVLLGILFDRKDLILHAESMVTNVKDEMTANPAYYSNWARVLLKLIRNPFEVAIVGKDYVSSLRKLQQHFSADVVYCGSGESEDLPLLEQKFRPGKTMIYVCVNKVCQLPVMQPEKALKQMEDQRLSLNMANKL